MPMNLYYYSENTS